MRPFGELFLEPRFDQIPPELREQPWAVWKAEPRPNTPDKFNKAPRNPNSGRMIGTDKPELFGRFEEAQAAYTGGGYTGVGVLLTGNGIIGIDIDDFRQCLPQNPELQAWMRAARDEGIYIETSPSGNGLRAFVRGTLAPETARKRGPLEIYDNKRFLTVTGHAQDLGGGK